MLPVYRKRRHTGVPAATHVVNKRMLAWEAMRRVLRALDVPGNPYDKDGWCYLGKFRLWGEPRRRRVFLFLALYLAGVRALCVSVCVCNMCVLTVCVYVC